MRLNDAAYQATGVIGATRGEIRGYGNKDFRERVALTWAERLVAEGEHFFALAQQADPQVGGYSRPHVVDQNGTLGVLDYVLGTDPVTEILFNLEIAMTADDIKRVVGVVDAELVMADERAAAIRREKEEADKILKVERKKLWEVRTMMFEEALKHHNTA